MKLQIRKDCYSLLHGKAIFVGLIVVLSFATGIGAYYYGSYLQYQRGWNETGDRGVDDGFEDGYDDGFDDGFEDGVDFIYIVDEEIERISPTIDGHINVEEWNLAPFIQKKKANVLFDQEMASTTYVYAGNDHDYFYLGFDFIDAHFPWDDNLWFSLFLNTQEIEFNSVEEMQDRLNAGIEIFHYNQKNMNRPFINAKSQIPLIEGQNIFRTFTNGSDYFDFGTYSYNDINIHFMEWNVMQETFNHNNTNFNQNWHIYHPEQIAEFIDDYFLNTTISLNMDDFKNSISERGENLLPNEIVLRSMCFRKDGNNLFHFENEDIESYNLTLFIAEEEITTSNPNRTTLNIPFKNEYLDMDTLEITIQADVKNTIYSPLIGVDFFAPTLKIESGIDYQEIYAILSSIQNSETLVKFGFGPSLNQQTPHLMLEIAVPLNWMEGSREHDLAFYFQSNIFEYTEVNYEQRDLHPSFIIANQLRPPIFSTNYYVLETF